MTSPTKTELLLRQTPLLEAHGRDVRAWAAAHVLTSAPDKGRHVLEQISKEPGDDLDYMHARFYNMQLGRFLSVDPADRRESLPRPLIWNRYSYAAGNPMKFIDPDGRDIRIASGRGHKALKKLLVESVRRPSGRAYLTEIAENKKFTLTLRSGPISGNAEALMRLRQGQRASVVHGQTTAHKVIKEGKSTTVGANVTLDLAAITMHHTDRSGLTTFNHEGFHAWELEQGKSMNEVAEGDLPTNATGTAALFGASIAAELPDLTREEARDIVNAWRSARTSGH